MELGGEFCLVCGSPPPLFGQRICEACFRERLQLVKIPKNINWSRCPRCQITKIDKSWVKVDDDWLWDELMQQNLHVHEDAKEISIGLHTQMVDERNTMLHVQVSAKIENLSFEEEHVMRARKSNEVCLTCSRKDGNYFEATVQLRSSARKLSESEFKQLRETLDEVIENLGDDPMFFITKEGPVTGGYDVVLGSKGLAKSWARFLINRYGGQSTTTASVVGRKDGQDLTRLTVLYRKPGYDLGDVIRWRAHLWRIWSWSSDGAILQKIERKEKTGASWRDLESGVVMATLSEHYVVDLVNQDLTVGEFLNPDTWHMESVRLPYDHAGKTSLRLARIEGEWFSLPQHPMDVKP